MKAKKIISGIIIIGMTFGLTGISFAGEKNNRRNNNRQVVEVDKHQNRPVAVKVDNCQNRQTDRIYHGKKSRDRYQGRNNRYNTNDRYYSRNDRHETDRRNPPHVNKQSQKDNNTHLKLRTIVTPFGIFPVIW